MEPPLKNRKIDDSELKMLLRNMHSTFLSKLKDIEEKIEVVTAKYHLLEQKVENILITAKESNTKLPYPRYCNVSNDATAPKFVPTNSRETYPDGSWLGDPSDPDHRVRCHITRDELEDINSTSPSADKMALTLLDNLFDKETQARSNISGTGKHGKEQLDPLKVYGIKCHVIYRFGINHKEWLRIKQNIDSKCRFAFRRKQKGLPLHIRGTNRDKRRRRHHQLKPENESATITTVLDSVCEQSMIIAKEDMSGFDYIEDEDLGPILPLKLDPDGSLTFTDGSSAQIIHTDQGDIQVIQATEEQLQQLKQNHHVEILAESSDILSDPILNTSI